MKAADKKVAPELYGKTYAEYAKVLVKAPAPALESKPAPNPIAAAPTSEEWEVVVTGVPEAHRGAIMNLVGPGEAESVGRNKVVLRGFYDDREAANVARAVTRQYGVVASYGPARAMKLNAAESVGTPAAGECGCTKNPVVETAEEARPKRVGGNRLYLPWKRNGASLETTDEGVSYMIMNTYTPEGYRLYVKHPTKSDYGFMGAYKTEKDAIDIAEDMARSYRWAVDYQRKNEIPQALREAPAALETRSNPIASDFEGEEQVCKPFTRISRDPGRFTACMARAKQIGELKNSLDFYRLVAPDIQANDEEHFYVACIDYRGQLRDFVDLAIGQRHKVSVDIEDIMAAVILSKCDGFVCCHGHPSGNASPSDADRKLTNMIRKAQRAACPATPLLDHLVIGIGSYFSFADGKLTRVNSK